jgi:hypothetical protein
MLYCHQPSAADMIAHSFRAGQRFNDVSFHAQTGKDHRFKRLPFKAETKKSATQKVHIQQKIYYWQSAQHNPQDGIGFTYTPFAPVDGVDGSWLHRPMLNPVHDGDVGVMHNTKRKSSSQGSQSSSDEKKGGLHLSEPLIKVGLYRVVHDLVGFEHTEVAPVIFYFFVHRKPSFHLQSMMAMSSLWCIGGEPFWIENQPMELQLGCPTSIALQVLDGHKNHFLPNTGRPIDEPRSVVIDFKVPPLEGFAAQYSTRPDYSISKVIASLSLWTSASPRAWPAMKDGLPLPLPVNATMKFSFDHGTKDVSILDLTLVPGNLTVPTYEFRYIFVVYHRVIFSNLTITIGVARYMSLVEVKHEIGERTIKNGSTLPSCAIAIVDQYGFPIRPTPSMTIEVSSTQEAFMPTTLLTGFILPSNIQLTVPSDRFESGSATIPDTLTFELRDNGQPVAGVSGHVHFRIEKARIPRKVVAYKCDDPTTRVESAQGVAKKDKIEFDVAILDDHDQPIPFHLLLTGAIDADNEQKGSARSSSSSSSPSTLHDCGVKVTYDDRTITHRFQLSTIDDTKTDRCRITLQIPASTEQFLDCVVEGFPWPVKPASIEIGVEYGNGSGRSPPSVLLAYRHTIHVQAIFWSGW